MDMNVRFQLRMRIFLEKDSRCDSNFGEIFFSLIKEFINIFKLNFIFRCKVIGRNSYKICLI